jgi:hypothetical protein
VNQHAVLQIFFSISFNRHRLVVPEIFQRIRQFGPSPKKRRSATALPPAVLLLNLLWLKNPPIMLEELMGINLSAGGYASQAEQGQWLYAEFERLGRLLNLYYLGGYGLGVVEVIDWEKSVENDVSSPGKNVTAPLGRRRQGSSGGGRQ